MRNGAGWPTGATPPMTWPVDSRTKPLRTLVDTWLEPYDVVWAAAGHAHTVFPTSFAELVRITGGTPAEVSAGPRP